MGDVERTVELKDLQSAECPISLISRHPEMEMMAVEILNMWSVNSHVGAVPFGPDSTKWPARWHEAVMVAGAEQLRFERARDQVRLELSKSQPV